MDSIRIKQLSEEDRPREKLLKYGASQLSDTELLAIIIGSGTRGNSAIQLAQKLLAQYQNDLNKIASQNALALESSQKGLGKVRAINIIAALELSKRRYIQQYTQKENPITSSDISAKYFMRYLTDKTQEEFWVLLLNTAHIPIDCYQVSKGNIDNTLVDIRLLCKYAIINNATRVIIAHNHPSGNLKPSEQDISLTKRIKEALSTLNISLLDHLIIYQNAYYSFADEGKI